MTSRSGAVTVTPREMKAPSTGVGRLRRYRQVHVDVGRGPRVAVPGQGERPAELVGHAERVEHFVQADDPGGQRPERRSATPCSSPGAPAPSSPPPGVRNGGNSSGSGSRGVVNGSICSAKFERSMSVSPGSRRCVGPGGRDFERPRHAARCLDEAPGVRDRMAQAGPWGVAGGQQDSTARRAGPGPPSVSNGRPARLPGRLEHVVGEAREVGQRASPGALGRVDRLPDLEAAPWDGRPRTPYPL